MCHMCGALVLVGQRIVRVRADGRWQWPHRSCWLAEAGFARRVEDIFLPGDAPAR